jgi:hypothetical protein
MPPEPNLREQYGRELPITAVSGPNNAEIETKVAPAKIITLI